MSQKKSQRSRRQTKEENRILLEFLNIQAELEKVNNDKKSSK
jgi:hypothetical protein